jgi:hypothetical protein
MLHMLKASKQRLYVWGPKASSTTMQVKMHSTINSGAAFNRSGRHLDGAVTTGVVTHSMLAGVLAHTCSNAHMQIQQDA